MLHDPGSPGLTLGHQDHVMDIDYGSGTLSTIKRSNGWATSSKGQTAPMIRRVRHGTLRLSGSNPSRWKAEVIARLEGELLIPEQWPVPLMPAATFRVTWVCLHASSNFSFDSERSANVRNRWP
jgi:hypothetical protein